MERQVKVKALNDLMKDFLRIGLKDYANQEKYYSKHIKEKTDNETVSICLDEDYFNIFSLLEAYFKRLHLTFANAKLTFLQSSDEQQLAKTQLEFDMFTMLENNPIIHVSIIYKQFFDYCNESFIKSKPIQITISVK